MVPKGYWINHVEEIIDQEAFDRYVTKVNALIERGEFKMIAIGPVAKTQIGAKDMQFAAVAEFETFEKAMSFISHPDYVDALNELGADEIISVKRTSCVVSGSSLCNQVECCKALGFGRCLQPNSSLII